MRLSASLIPTVYWVAAAVAAVTSVRKTGQGPTGYLVDFVFPSDGTNHSNVLLGGFPFFSDPLHASLSKTNGYSPYSWKPDDFSMRLSPDYGNENATLAGVNMTWNAQSEEWTISVPLPSGTWLYAYYPDCAANWEYVCTTQLTDPTNPPIELYQYNENLSAIQVPFDRNYQRYDYDWQLPPADPAHRGNIIFDTYYSPGSTYPRPDYHDVGIYLPVGYEEQPNRTYPVLYLSNGGQGTEADWFQQGRAHSIADNLIASGRMEPTVIVCPNFYDLGFTFAEYETNATLQAEYLDVIGYERFFNVARENFNAYLFPYIEATYRVSKDPSTRAFGGLALGGTFGLTMLFNSTTNFSSYVIMSPTPAPSAGDAAYNTPGLRNVGIFTGAGFYDTTFDAARDWQTALAEEGIGYLSHYPMNGAHQWSTWQQMLYVYLRDVLWQPVPYTADTNDRSVGTLPAY